MAAAVDRVVIVVQLQHDPTCPARGLVLGTMTGQHGCRCSAASRAFDLYAQARGYFGGKVTIRVEETL